MIANVGETPDDTDGDCLGHLSMLARVSDQHCYDRLAS